MRISDWSSDVCSSDLFVLEAWHDPQYSRDPPAGRQGLAAVPEAARLLRAGRHRRLVLPRPGQAVGLLRGLADAADRDGLRGVLFHFHLADGRTQGAKSEERRVGKAGVSTCRYRWSPN